MGFMEAVKHVFKNYATFSGRARRSEYWYFTLFNVLVITVLSILSSVIGVATYSRSSGAAAAGSLIGSGLMMLYSFAVMIPGLAVTCRRLHDVGKAGTYILFALIPFVGSILLLVWECQDSMPGSNQYGPNPKGVNAAGWGGNPAMGGPVGGPAPANPYSGTMDQIPSAQTPSAQTPPARQMPLQPQPQQSAGGFRLVDLTGSTGESTFIELSGTMLVGRAPDCAIRYPADTPCVSAHHCQLIVNGSQLLIQDVGSTYGTFINSVSDDHKLQPNLYYALKKGDRICLGSPEFFLIVDA